MLFYHRSPHTYIVFAQEASHERRGSRQYNHRDNNDEDRNVQPDRGEKERNGSSSNERRRDGSKGKERERERGDEREVRHGSMDRRNGRRLQHGHSSEKLVSEEKPPAESPISHASTRTTGVNTSRSGTPVQNATRSGYIKMANAGYVGGGGGGGVYSSSPSFSYLNSSRRRPHMPPSGDTGARRPTRILKRNPKVYSSPSLPPSALLLLL